MLTLARPVVTNRPSYFLASYISSSHIRPASHYTMLNPYFTRQIARAKEIKTHFLQKQAHESKDARKAAERGATGAIVSLGLVEEEGSGGGK
jgi:hypothetical protein